MMQRKIIHRKSFWILGVIALWWFLCIFHFISSNPSQQQTQRSSLVTQLSSSINPKSDPKEACDGKYIYIHSLPTVFNEDLLSSTCNEVMCNKYINGGLGPKLEEEEEEEEEEEGSVGFSKHAWFSTDEYALEVIFHSRMNQYECLTNDPSRASLIYVPFYGGLDIARNLWGTSVSVRDHLSEALGTWLRAQKSWSEKEGQNHFLVCGRMSWDFRRQTNEESDWGNRLFLVDEVKNMWNLLVEKSLWHDNDFAIPYPTDFHPTTMAEVENWQARVRKKERSSLMAFVRSSSSPMEHVGSIKWAVRRQCNSSNQCTLLECGIECDSSLTPIKAFEKSVFCLLPQGESSTSRTIFDSMLAGCIPVFFHPNSAYMQYMWHLPKNHSLYSVFIPQHLVKADRVQIESVLNAIPPSNVARMREMVISLIPTLIYANPNTSLPPDFEDAFDVAVRALLAKVHQLPPPNI